MIQSHEHWPLGSAACADLAIEVSDLVKHYGTTRAVDGVSFGVHRGEIFGLLGPNGAGKTTTVECIEGLRRPDSGRIVVLSMQHGRDTRQIKAGIGVQLQTTGLYPKLTVRELIDLFGTFYPRRLPTDDVIAVVDLGDKQGTRSKNLSGGQRQRLSLALAMVSDPELMFLDEPTTGLDPQARRSTWDIVRELKRRGKTVVLTTHYMEEAEQLCDRVAVVDHGRIVELDRPSALVNKYFRESAIEFATEGRWAADQLKTLAAVNHAMVEGDRAVLYSADVPRTMAALFELPAGGASGFQNLTVRQATLEDVFLKLTGRRIRE